MTDLALETSAELVHANPALPLSPEEAREAMTTYQAISRALIEPADDIQVIETRKGPREFPKRSAFQKLANAYRVSTRIVARELTHDEQGALLRCDAIVRATHPDGRFAEGDGACSRGEERFQRGGEKIDHDLPATAVTRATNRAISNLVAFGAVSAEEATATDTTPAVSELPSWAEEYGDVGQVAGWLVDILTAAGVDDAATTTKGIGQRVREVCEGAIPVCVAVSIARIHEAVTDAAVDAEVAP